MNHPASAFSSLDEDQRPIVALASGPSLGPIAVLRVSGRGCHELVRACLRMQRGAAAPWLDRHQYWCEFIDPLSQQVIDDPLVCFFTAPHSYTGQDSVEISLHGSPYVVTTATQILYQQGCRPAEAGEFTRRAFLHGKMDLTAAEGVRELLNASSHQQWLAARQLTSGKLRDAVDHLRSTLLEAQAWLAARIDFPDEEETSRVPLEQVRVRVERVGEAISALLSTYSSGQVAVGGLKVALLGEPNAGKSTLLNTLLGKERAIVSPIPGTTRDYLDDACLIDGRLIRLIDTAGLRDAGCAVEQEGIKRSLQLAREADLVLLLVPSDGSTAGLEAQVQRLAAAGIVYQVVRTKSDLPVRESLSSALASRSALVLSCHNDEGLQELKQFMVSRVDRYVHELEEGICISSARHKYALDQAQDALARFFTALHQQAYDEILAFELQQASNALDSLVGKIAADDILGAVFSTFCVGK